MPALVQALTDQGAEGIIVFVGGVIRAQDYDFLYKAGAAGTFGPGTPICAKQAACAKQVLETKHNSRIATQGGAW